MSGTTAIDIVPEIATEVGVDPHLAQAITLVESSGVQWVCRFEPAWKYFCEVEKNALALGISFETERNHQATSWGLMQVMGSVAREFQFTGHLTMLCVPEIGARLGCKKLLSLVRRYNDENDVIASYNAGSPKRGSDGKYVNQAYVGKVADILKGLRS